MDPLKEETDPDYSVCKCTLTGIGNRKRGFRMQMLFVMNTTHYRLYYLLNKLVEQFKAGFFLSALERAFLVVRVSTVSITYISQKGRTIETMK